MHIHRRHPKLPEEVKAKRFLRSQGSEQSEEAKEPPIAKKPVNPKVVALSRSKSYAGQFQYACVLFDGKAFPEHSEEEKAQDVKSATDIFEHLSLCGYKDAQEFLGNMYLYGNHVDVDVEKGVQLLERAAIQGSHESLRTLGSGYFAGAFGIPEDKRIAMKWFRLGCNVEDPECMTFYGSYLLIGLEDPENPQKFIVPQNEKEGFKMLRKAAARGSGGAWNKLGQCFMNGMGTEVDAQEAFRCFTLAGEMNHGGGLYHLFLCYTNEDIDPKLEHNIQKGMDALRRSAEAGFEKAQVSLAVAYLRGTMIKQNLSEAMRWAQILQKKGGDFFDPLVHEIERYQRMEAESIPTIPEEAEETP